MVDDRARNRRPPPEEMVGMVEVGVDDDGSRNPALRLPPLLFRRSLSSSTTRCSRTRPPAICCLRCSLRRPSIAFYSRNSRSKQKKTHTRAIGRL